MCLQAREYEPDCAGGGDMSLLNHNQTHAKMEETNCNILLNTIVHNERAHGQARLRRSALDRHDPTDYPDGGVVMGDMLSHVRMMNEEIHQRHVAQDADEHYKSEWRMVALILDRILLILFFLMTSFTCIVIFINVPHWETDVTAL